MTAEILAVTGVYYSSTVGDRTRPKWFPSHFELIVPVIQCRELTTAVTFVYHPKVGNKWVSFATENSLTAENSL
jgi:hypothetical protein